MNIEQSALERRAARFAALGDPGRLQIVDALALGDRSPGELRALLNAPSNLVAHHLMVLERAGLIDRVRSEGDRRRSYVRLLADAPEPVSTSTVHAARVVFVCKANSARSQLAAALWHRHSAVPVISAGTNPADRISAGAIAAAERHKLELRSARPQSIYGVVGERDLVITVCDVAHEALPPSRLHWSIPDPVRIGTPQAFDAAFDEIARRIGVLAPRVQLG